MDQPVLYVFAISHYCEKARWALDYLGIEYSLKFLPPGVHGRVAKKLGVPGTSLPILQLGEKIIQGSSQIIDWAELNRDPARQSLESTTDHERSRTLERRMDEELGVHIRRYYYSEALLEFPASVLPVFSRDLPMLQKAFTVISWPMINRVMIKRMDLGYRQGLESRTIIEVELDWLDALLADDQPFLCGDRLSRVDITAASLLAPLVQPANHPSYIDMALPPRVMGDFKLWSTRRCVRWVEIIYQQYR
jgi:glutathione S-transferase